MRSSARRRRCARHAPAASTGRHEVAAIAATFACLALNLPGTAAGAASPWFCGSALARQWVPPWLPQPAPDRRDLACHLMAGCRREDQEQHG